MVSGKSNYIYNKENYTVNTSYTVKKPFCVKMVFVEIFVKFLASVNLT